MSNLIISPTAKVRIIEVTDAHRKNRRWGRQARQLMLEIARDVIDWYHINDYARKESCMMSPEEAYLFAAFTAASHIPHPSARPGRAGG